MTATIAAPALINEFGVAPLAAHMFVFYFGIVADITPPVCLAAYAGAGIAKANPFKTGVTAVKLAIAAFHHSVYIHLQSDARLCGCDSWKLITECCDGAYLE